MDWSQWYSGWEEREKYNTSKRREFARAFETFKKDNPYATAKDYQDYIDQFAGNSNYIRGGAPSSDVLQSMADENQKNLQVKRDREAHDARMAEFTRMNQYKEFAQPYLMGGDPSGIEERKGQFKSAIGNVTPLVSGMLDNYFTNENYMTQQGQLLLSKVDQAASYLTRVGGTVKDKKQFAQLLGIQPHFVDPLIDMASQEYDKRRQDHWLDKTGNLETRVISLAQRGGDIDAFLKDIGENGMFELPPNLETNLRSLYGSETERVNNTLSQEAAGSYTTIANGMRSNPNFMLGLSNDSRANIIERIRNQFVNQMSPDQFKRHFGAPPEDVGDSKFENIADELIREAQNNQSHLRSQSQDEVRGEVTSMISKNIMERFDEGVKQLGEANYESDEAGPKVVEVFSNLANRFYPSPALQSRLYQMARELQDQEGDNWTPSMLYQRALQDNAMSNFLENKSDYSQNAVNDAIELRGGYDIEQFDEWANGFTDKQDEIISTLKTYPGQIEDNSYAKFPIPQNATEKEQVQTEMNQIIDQVKEFEKYAAEVESQLRGAEMEWTNRKEKSGGPKSWIKTGTTSSRWLDTEANPIRESYTSEYNEMLQAIKTYREQLKEKYMELEQKNIELNQYDPNQRDDAVTRLLNFLVR